jgi:hypothetical protein
MFSVVKSKAECSFIQTGFVFVSLRCTKDRDICCIQRLRCQDTPVLEMGRYMPVCHTGPSFVPTFHTGTVCFSVTLQQNEV